MTALVLHIGTHKTATTSIQHCCATNLHLLERFGIHYPRFGDNAYTQNGVAGEIAFGRNHVARRWLAEARERARARGLGTVLISAESFYAMTGTYYAVYDRPHGDYFSREREFVEVVRDIAWDFDDIGIIVNFRPQDGLASSFYNQYVKNALGLCDEFSDFVARIRPVFDYDGHVRIWEDAFGPDSVRVGLYGTGDVLRGFFGRLIAKEQTDMLVRTEFSANERLPRDVLETKRFYNARRADRVEGFVAARFFRQISSNYADAPGYQIFSPVSQRREIWQGFEAGNADLCRRHGLAALPTMRDMSEPTYPGLRPETREEIERAFRSYIHSPRVMAEVALRRAAHAIEQKMPAAKASIDALRTVNNYFRLHVQGW